ncbi:restriction endonuclease subunit S [Methanotrichaceae archaeon M04Ac]|uniref:Restriction endonuclease subunit S n=1 Tax=Candidatus Methanocrinis alkalitolerans TaxID=3033395 RepID=A0ABT5XBL4_9EURY|nr:restriction endonuclease subunit S [Candidatus Methanocrinis alkalitolerans]MDF0592099.1 restriction endonuclease subunit S [Candidatus Methanocrinis alkalitolerans]
MKDSNDQSISALPNVELPIGWSLTKINDIVDYDGLFKDGDWVESKDQDPNGNVRLIQLADIGDGFYRNKSDRFLTYDKAIELNCSFLESEDILIARMPDPLGRTCIFPGDPKPCVTAVDVCIVRTGKQGANHNWLMYIVNSPDFRTTIESLQSGSTRKRISRKNLSKIEFPLPPLPEQRRIVTKIEELFTQLDAGVSALEKSRAQLKRYRQSVLKAAVEGKLTEEWRRSHPDVEPASVLLERIEREREKSGRGRHKKLQPLDVSELPELPVEWEWTRLDFLAALKGGITKDSKRKSNNSRSIPYLRVANVQRGFLDLREIKEIEAPKSVISELLLEPGDILFTEGGDRDKLGRGWIWQGELPECIHQNHVFRARLYSNDVSNKFVSWFGNTYGQRYFMREGKQTTNLASINLTKLRGFPVSLPPKEEQKEIVSEIECRLSVADQTEANLEANLRRAARLRQSILKKAFRGELMPQDPSDEPASVLLERIRMERSQARPINNRGQARRGRGRPRKTAAVQTELI